MYRGTGGGIGRRNLRFWAGGHYLEGLAHVTEEVSMYGANPYPVLSRMPCKAR